MVVAGIHPGAGSGTATSGPGHRRRRVGGRRGVRIDRRGDRPPARRAAPGPPSPARPPRHRRRPAPARRAPPRSRPGPAPPGRPRRPAPPQAPRPALARRRPAPAAGGAASGVVEAGGRPAAPGSRAPQASPTPAGHGATWVSWAPDPSPDDLGVVSWTRTGVNCSAMIGATWCLTAGMTTVAATVATMPVVAAAAAVTPMRVAVVAAAAFMATTRPSVCRPEGRGPRARVSARATCWPRAVRPMASMTAGSSASSWASAGPRAQWMSERTSRYHHGALRSRCVPSQTASATWVSNWVMSTQISSRGVTAPPPLRRSWPPGGAGPGGRARGRRPAGAA